MAMQTWQFQIGGQNGQTIAVKAKKDEAKAIARHIADLFRLSQTVREYWTWYDKPTGKLEENVSTMQTLIGPAGFPVRDPEAFQAKRDAFMTKIAHFTITPESWKPLAQEITAMIDAHVPINDRRKTIEQHIADDAASAERQKKFDDARAAQHSQFLSEWGDLSGNLTMNRADGDMCVYAELTTDRSDAMSDYFDRYGTVTGSKPLALGFTRKQAQTQAIARGFVNQYAELAALKWEWHTENYSMGKGNYLASSYFKYTGIDGKEISACWFVSFDAYGKEFHPFRGYTENKLRQPEPTTGTAEPTRAGNCKISRNYQHNGIELRFDEKPDAATLDIVRALGFKFSFRQRIWYATYSESLMTRVSERLGQCPMTPSQPDPEPGDMDTAHEDYMMDTVAANIGA